MKFLKENMELDFENRTRTEKTKVVRPNRNNVHNNDLEERHRIKK
jgi:hypothetical protein